MKPNSGQHDRISPDIDSDIVDALDVFCAVFKELVLANPAMLDADSCSSVLGEAFIVTALQMTGSSGVFPVDSGRVEELVRATTLTSLSEADANVLREILEEDSEPTSAMKKLIEEFRQRKG